MALTICVFTVTSPRHDTAIFREYIPSLKPYYKSQVFAVRFLAGEKEFSVLQNQDPHPVRYSADTIRFQEGPTVLSRAARH